MVVLRRVFDPEHDARLREESRRVVLTGVKRDAIHARDGSLGREHARATVCIRRAIEEHVASPLQHDAHPRGRAPFRRIQNVGGDSCHLRLHHFLEPKLGDLPLLLDGDAQLRLAIMR